MVLALSGRMYKGLNHMIYDNEAIEKHATTITSSDAVIVTATTCHDKHCDKKALS